jgi:hypothetical protein
MRKLLCDKVRNKAFSLCQVRYIPEVHAMTMGTAAWHIKQTIVFQIQEDLEDAS